MNEKIYQLIEMMNQTYGPFSLTQIKNESEAYDLKTMYKWVSDQNDELIIYYNGQWANN